MGRVELLLVANDTNHNSRLQLTRSKKGVIWFDQVSAMPLDTFKSLHCFWKVKAGGNRWGSTLSSLSDEFVGTVGVVSLLYKDFVSERRRKLEFLEMQEKRIKVKNAIQKTQGDLVSVDKVVRSPNF